MMPEMIAYCGLDCARCDAFTAAQSGDHERKQKIAERWSKELKAEFTPEDIDCNGCKSDRVSGWCTRICAIRPCAQQRKVESCAHCQDYPCSKLKEFLSHEPDATNTLQGIREELLVQ